MVFHQNAKNVIRQHPVSLHGSRTFNQLYSHLPAGCSQMVITTTTKTRWKTKEFHLQEYTGGWESMRRIFPRSFISTVVSLFVCVLIETYFHLIHRLLMMQLGIDISFGLACVSLCHELFTFFISGIFLFAWFDFYHLEKKKWGRENCDCRAFLMLVFWFSSFMRKIFIFLYYKDVLLTFVNVWNSNWIE